MAVMSITIPDAAVPRVQAAFGHHQIPVDPTSPWILATPAEVQKEIVHFLNQRTHDYEARLAAEDAIENLPPPPVP